MQLFISFSLEIYGDDPLLVLEVASDLMKERMNVSNLYIHDGKGNAFQANRRCDCGSHFFKDVPLGEDWQKFPSLPPEHFVACMKCGKTYPVQ